jgi:hypothetical protein
VTAREVADRRMDVRVDPDREEALEPLAALVEHAEGGVLRARQLARDLEDALQQPLDVELRDEGLADVEEPEQALLAEDGFPGGRGQRRAASDELGVDDTWRRRRSNPGSSGQPVRMRTPPQPSGVVWLQDRHFPPSPRPAGADVIREGKGAMHVGG